jgi:diguanylate cyclase
LGGDEFAILMPATSLEAAQKLANAVLAMLREPVPVNELKLLVGASIGIAWDRPHPSILSTLLRRADVAMYAAKQSGRGFSVYDPNDDPHSVTRLGLLGELNDAIREGQLRLQYQPRVRVQDGALVGVEALVRWQHPRHGWLLLGSFVPLAELGQVIRSLTDWVLDQALAQAALWQARGLDLRVAVNLSARLLVDESLVEQVCAALKRHGLTANALELEITESGIIADPSHALELVRELRAMGVRVSIDDFGTGYSSLSHLKNLPVHALKIDRSFVRDMQQDPPSRAIVQSTIQLAQNLQLDVVAEGVEDEQTLAQLSDLGCHEVQGFLVAEPLDANVFEHWLQSRVKTVP